MITHTIGVPVNDRSWLQGRNGMADIKTIRAEYVSSNEGVGRVFLTGISKTRDVALNGGISIDAVAMDELCLEWLAYRKADIQCHDCGQIHTRGALDENDWVCTKCGCAMTDANAESHA